MLHRCREKEALTKKRVWRQCRGRSEKKGNEKQVWVCLKIVVIIRLLCKVLLWHIFCSEKMAGDHKLSLLLFSASLLPSAHLHRFFGAWAVRGGVTGRVDDIPPYWYLAFFSEGFRIWAHTKSSKQHLKCCLYHIHTQSWLNGSQIWYYLIIWFKMFKIN